MGKDEIISKAKDAVKNAENCLDTECERLSDADFGKMHSGNRFNVFLDEQGDRTAYDKKTGMGIRFNQSGTVKNTVDLHEKQGQFDSLERRYPSIDSEIYVDRAKIEGRALRDAINFISGAGYRVTSEGREVAFLEG